MSNFVANILKLVSGSVTAQILGVLLVPLITRIYSPDDLGTFQIFLSTSGILVIFSTFSYQFAIMLPKTEEDSANVSFLCAILVTLVSLFTTLLVILFPKDIEYLFNIFNTPGIPEYLIYIPAITFFNGIFFVQNYWLSRKIRFGVIAGSRIINTISTKAFQLVIPIWNVSPLGLIAGYVAGYGCADLFMLKGVREDLKIFKKVSLKRMKEMAIEYKNFPLFSSWSTLANTISPQVPTFILAYYYGTSVVGYFSLAYQVVNLPMALLGTAIQQVFFQKISEVKNGNESGDMKVIVGEVYKKLILIGIFPMILLMILGEEIFTFAFGKSWYISGVYIKILVPWIFLVFLSSPISTLYSVFDKQRTWLVFSIILLISRVAALVIGGSSGRSPEFALALFSFTGVLFWLWNNAYLLNLAGINKIESVKVLIKYTTIGIIVSIPLILLEVFSVNFYIVLLAVGIITPIYYVITLHDDPTFKSMFSAFVVNVKSKI
jgi:lipopolysaccharide exporter